MHWTNWFICCERKYSDFSFGYSFLQLFHQNKNFLNFSFEVKKRESYMAIRICTYSQWVFLTSMQHVRNYSKPYTTLKQNDIFLNLFSAFK